MTIKNFKPDANRVKKVYRTFLDSDNSIWSIFMEFDPPIADKRHVTTVFMVVR